MDRLFKDLVKLLLKKYNYDISYNSENKISGKYLDRDIKLLIKHESPVCFDVGANIGQTINFLRDIFTSPQIYSFEPSSESFGFLQSQNYPFNVHINQIALEDSNSEKKFTNYEGSTLSSFLAFDNNLGNPFKDIKVKNKEIVVTRTLDWFVEENNISKIDGSSEYKGIRKINEKDKPVI